MSEITDTNHRKDSNNYNYNNNGQILHPPMLVTLLVFFHNFVLVAFAYFREFLRRVKLEKNRCSFEESAGKMSRFVPLYSDFESLYARNIFRRLCDCFNRPIGSSPGRTVQFLNRISRTHNWTFEMAGGSTECVNFGSYNYLGFAQNSGPCIDDVVETIKHAGIGVCSAPAEFGNLHIHHRLEKLVAEFLGVESAMCFPMGFATNSMNINCFVGKNCLILSDELNHASIILGCRLSGASIQVFKHNDIEDLEQHLRRAVVYGQPRTRRPYKKILICVEGIYSMEGTIAKLPEILQLKKKYKAYLYLDEAHSIGSVGKRGRGVCDYFNVDPREIDVMMGTFTKSFGSVGGYLAGKKSIIDYLKRRSHSVRYGTNLSPPCAQQILTSMSIIMRKDLRDDGQKRIETLARNSRYFRLNLHKMGFVTSGPIDSPVVPLFLYSLAKIAYASRDLFARQVAAVVVGFPATPIALARARFCMSAAHTKEDLDKVLRLMDRLGDVLNVKYLNRDQCGLKSIEY